MKLVLFINRIKHHIWTTLPARYGPTNYNICVYFVRRTAASQRTHLISFIFQTKFHFLMLILFYFTPINCASLGKWNAISIHVPNEMIRIPRKRLKHTSQYVVCVFFSCSSTAMRLFETFGVHIHDGDDDGQNHGFTKKKIRSFNES